MRLSAEDIALAMELSNNGVPLKMVAPELGVSLDSLYTALRDARRHGFAMFAPRSHS